MQRLELVRIRVCKRCGRGNAELRGDGVDVLVALALGASAVLVARPTAWGLAVDGQAGVEAVLAFLCDGFVNAMANAGCRTVQEITRDLVRPA